MSCRGWNNKARRISAVSSRRISANLAGPFLRRLAISPERVDLDRYPFNIPAFSRGIDIKITSNVTFFVGENGSGKSTLLEGIAENSGFNAEGGGREHNFANHKDRSDLSSALQLSWLPKVTDGFFMRADCCYTSPVTSSNQGAHSEGTVAARSTSSPTASHSSHCSPIVSAGEYTFSTNLKLRCRRRGN